MQSPTLNQRSHNLQRSSSAASVQNQLFRKQNRRGICKCKGAATSTAASGKKIFCTFHDFFCFQKFGRKTQSDCNRISLNNDQRQFEYLIDIGYEKFFILPVKWNVFI